MHDTAIYLRKRIIGSIEKEPPRPHNPEVVGSNPAPATKNFVARKLNGFRAFLLAIDMMRLRLSLRCDGAE